MKHFNKVEKSKWFNLKLTVLILLLISYVLKLFGVW